MSDTIEESTHDFTRDEMPPEDILEQLDVHDRRMEENRPIMQRIKAANETRWVAHTTQEKNSDKKSQASKVSIEVNYIYRVTVAFLAALFPGPPEPVVKADPTGRGTPDLARRVLKQWVSDDQLRLRLEDASRQGLHYYGAGVAVGYDPGSAPAYERVWMRVIPCWEMVLDDGVGDPKDARFIGRAHYQSLKKIARRYNIEESDLQGCPRGDFLSGDSLGKRTARKADGASEKTTAASDSTKFVRVLEVCNFVDTYKDGEDVYVGRLEVYLLDQAGERFKKPVWMGPMNLSKPNGEGLAHILPLIFDHETESPLRPLSFAKTILPQVEEHNCYRTRMAQDADKAAKQYGIPEGLFTGEELQEFRKGTTIVEWDSKRVEELGFRTMKEAIVEIETGGIPQGVREYANIVERDLERLMPLSTPAITRDPSGATKYELGMIERYTDSENGRYGKARNIWLGQILFAVLRAIVAAMHHRAEDSTGGFHTQDEVDLAPTEARTDTSDDDAGDAEDRELVAENTSDADTAGGEEAIDVDPDLLRAVGDSTPDEQAPTLDEEVIDSEAPETLVFIGEKGERIEVTAEDLDANFSVLVSSFGQGPAQEAEDRKLLFTVLPEYLALWEKYLEMRDEPMGHVYRELLYTYAEEYSLPDRLHPDALLAKINPQPQEDDSPDPELAQAAAGAAGANTGGAAADQPPAQATPTAAAPAPAPAPADQPTTAPGAETDPLMAQLDAIAAMPLVQALQALSELLAENYPDDAATLAQIAANGTPEQQQQLLEDTMAALLNQTEPTP